MSMQSEPSTYPLQHLVGKLIHTTQIFRHLSVLELFDVSPQVKFLGHVYFEEDGDAYAVTQLLQELDRAIVFGDASENPLAFDGILSLIDVWGRTTRNRWCYSDPKEFYDRFERDKKQHNMRLFTITEPNFVGEGDLPPGGKRTFAIGKHALRWRQFMPMTSMSLVGEREGRLAANIGNKPIQWRHENSVERKRRVAIMYGYLELIEPEAVFQLIH